MTIDEQRRDESRARLRELLPPGSTVYMILRRRARSGMSRTMDFYAIHDGAPYYLSGIIASALGYRRMRGGELRVEGGGMDMGFHVAHSLSYALHGAESVGDDARLHEERGTPFAPEPDQFRAGYSLRHEWL